MSDQRAQGNIKVDGFGFTLGTETRRLDFPHATIDGLRGEAGAIEYRAREAVFDQLKASLSRVQWSTEAASAGDFVVRDKQGRFELKIARIELPRGVMLARSATGGVELITQHASLADMRLKIPNLAAYQMPTTTPAPVPAQPPPLRQGRLRFLDTVNGELSFRLKIVLDLPVVGTRTLDQHVKVAIKDGAFDYRALENGLSWLEGRFVDVEIDDGRFLIGWSVPLMATKEIISWALDPEAMMGAVFNRIPLRALADFRVPGSGGSGRAKDGKGGRGGSVLKSLAISDVAIHLSTAAPRRVEVGGGAILFGGDDAPGLVDLRLTGGLAGLPPGPGALKFAVGVADLTIKDVHAGGLAVTADRFHVGPIDSIEITFDGFTPTSLTASLHRVTATNLSLVLGGSPG